MELTQSLPPTLHTHEEAVAYFISQMDIEMVNSILDDNRTYQKLEKWEFMSRLQEIFDEYANSGDTSLLTFPAHCNDSECNKGKSGYIFYGNKTKNYFNLIFELDENKHVTDLCECYNIKPNINPDFEIGCRLFNLQDPPF